MAVDQARDHIGEVGLGLHVVELAAFDQGSEDRPGFAALVTAGEQSILAIQGNWADRSFYCVVSSSRRPSSRKRQSPSR